MGLEAGIPKKADPDEQVCFENRDAGAGGCIRRQPEVLPRLFGLWKLFNISTFADMNNGFSGRLDGRDMSKLEAIAAAVGEPWDAVTIERLRTIIDPYVKETNKRRGK